MRHVLTRALGGGAAVTVELTHTFLRPGDRFLLCTDGLWSAVPARSLERFFRHAWEPRATCSSVVERANQAGGRDNITAVIWDGHGPGERAP